VVVGPNCDRFSGETEELTRHHSRNTALDLVFLHRGRCLVSSVTFLRDLACRERVRNATRLGASSSIANCPSRCWNKRVYLLAICKENRFWKKRRDTMIHHTPRRFAWRSARLLDRMCASEDSAIELETRGLCSRVRSVDPPNERRH